MATILNKLEIDVMQVGELQEASELAAKHKLSGLVVHPGLAGEALVARGRVRGQFKLITPVDWPKGEANGMGKLQGLSTDALEADAFEILLSPNKSDGYIRDEAARITEFIHRHLSELTEVRFVLGTSVRDSAQLSTVCKGLCGVPSPSLLRNDISTKLQVSKANTDLHNANASIVHSIIKTPLKISGNINSIKSASSCTAATKFGVSLLQARSIVKEFHQQPDEVVRLLDSN